MDWTAKHQDEALAEGWGVFNGQIERNDTLARFDCNAAAQAFVAMRAIEGNGLARLAWIELAWHHAVIDAATERT